MSLPASWSNPVLQCVYQQVNLININRHLFISFPNEQFKLIENIAIITIVELLYELTNTCFMSDSNCFRISSLMDWIFLSVSISSRSSFLTVYSSYWIYFFFFYRYLAVEEFAICFLFSELLYDLRVVLIYEEGMISLESWSRIYDLSEISLLGKML